VIRACGEGGETEERAKAVKGSSVNNVRRLRMFRTDDFLRQKLGLYLILD